MTDTSSSSDNARRSFSRAVAKAREVNLSTTLNGESIARQNHSSLTNNGAISSVYFSASRFGVISPKTSSSTVMTGIAIQPPPGINREKR